MSIYSTPSFLSHLERSSDIFCLCSGRVIHEPIQMAGVEWFDPGSRQIGSWIIQDCFQDVLLFLSGRNKCNASCVIDDKIGQGYSLWWRLGGVLNVGNPTVVLIQELVAWKEGCSMTIGTHAQKDEVKDGVPRRVLCSKFSNQLCLIIVGKFFQVIEQCSVDSVNL